jgi:amino acid transporter
MLYVPTVMLYFVGVSVYVLGSGHQDLAENKLFAMTVALSLLALITALNIAGLGIGKWINNIGAIGTGIAAAVLIGLGIVLSLRFGTHFKMPDEKLVPETTLQLNQQDRFGDPTWVSECSSSNDQYWT